MSLHERSCMIDAFAVALAIPAEAIARKIGHNGVQGFHSQELIEYCLNRGYSVTAIERRPVAQHPVTLEIRPITFPEGNDKRFGRHLQNGNGVLMGRATTFSNKPHAVAWTEGQAWDPGAERWYPILTEDGRPDDVFFVPLTFLRID